jgi:hypothetical protein
MITIRPVVGCPAVMKMYWQLHLATDVGNVPPR